MSIWARISEFLTTVPANALSNLIEAVRTVFEGNPELRRRVAFSIALIALSAKMARADGIVTQAEVRAFQQIFVVPPDQTRNVALLFDLAKQDVAGFEAYAHQMAGLCGSGQRNCAMLEDILDGLFHIAKADGHIHEREVAFLRRVAEIFEIDETHFESILSRHAILGENDPWRVLGLERGTPFDAVRSHYRRLVADNHPDRLIARGVPEEFLAIANSRLAAINGAYEAIERSMQRT
ncbi:DnaJ family molecular chaperone [Mesorhizobium microcysteis]|jgi:DnaJ like chaperone protein|uniref:DnaJ family molecular chaperone n=1 Tax=Neoaquamicrobium microcysteis TaxID=2682781 RepID=A0A5D4GYL7_9HYPH|nr:DnaJ family molecular chaperone [Mesorhizobium microcysteis]TYR32365.1 DnaJ family molecular chaperone [Mesorhizobium microcysteis]